MLIPIKLFFPFAFAFSSITFDPSAAGGPVINGTSFGGGGGQEFSDPAGPSDFVFYLKIRGGKRLDYIEYRYRNSIGQAFPMKHGGSGGETIQEIQPDLAPIKRIEWYTAKHKGDKRVFFLKVIPTEGDPIQVGTAKGDFGFEDVPKGYRFGGLNGRAAAEIDRLQFVWVKDVYPAVLVEPALVVESN